MRLNAHQLHGCYNFKMWPFFVMFKNAISYRADLEFFKLLSRILEDSCSLARIF
jgi:hypothetical protein